MNKMKDEQETMLIKDAAQRKLINFCLYTDPKYQINWHHRVIANKLQEAYEKVKNGERARIILQVPPRHGKSELSSVKFPAYVLGKNPEYPIITTSYSKDLATDFGLKTKDLMKSHNYQALFNTRLRKDATAKAKWKTQSQGGYTAAGVGGSITGKGFKIGIVDDPIKNRDEADSEVIRDKIWKWWKSTFITREDGNGAIVVIMTRWHEDDLVGRILSDDWDGDPEDWEVIDFPAIATKHEDKRRKGEALWPDRFDLDYLENKKQGAGPYEWSALYQQNPVDEESREFKNSWIKPISWEKVDSMETRDFATIDPGGRKEEHDYTGIVRNYVDARNNWHIRAMRVHIGSDELINLIFQLHDEGFEKIGIEETIYMQTLKPFLDKEQRKRDIFPNIEPLRHAQRDKHVRIRGLIPRYSSGSVYHIEKECNDLEKEMRTFPKGTYDDTLDALAYQNEIAETPVDQVARALRKRDREERKDETKSKYGL